MISSGNSIFFSCHPRWWIKSMKRFSITHVFVHSRHPSRAAVDAICVDKDKKLSVWKRSTYDWDTVLPGTRGSRSSSSSSGAIEWIKWGWNYCSMFQRFGVSNEHSRAESVQWVEWSSSVNYANVMLSHVVRNWFVCSFARSLRSLPTDWLAGGWWGIRISRLVDYRMEHLLGRPGALTCGPDQPTILR